MGGKNYPEFSKTKSYCCAMMPSNLIAALLLFFGFQVGYKSG